MKNGKSKKGFSLIELAVVLVIVALLVGVIASSNRILFNSRLSTAQTLTKSSPVNDISGLTFWFETTMPASISDAQADNGKAVTTWFDLGPEKNNITGSVTYVQNGMNGLPVLGFNGSQSFTRANIRTTEIVQANQGTIFLVQNYNSGGGSTIQWNGGVRAINAHVTWSDGNLYFDFGGCCGVDTRTNSIPANFALKNNIVSLVRYPTSISSIFINGSLLISNASSSTIITDTALGTLTIGSGLVGTIAEIIVFDRGLSDSERRDVEQYLGKKWGITVS